MFFERLPEPIDALLISDTIDSSVISDVFSEVKAIASNDSGSGVWLNEQYDDPSKSIIHKASFDAVMSNEANDAMFSINSAYGLYSYINNHSTRVKYFGHRQSSMLHFDAAAFTAMTFLYDEPKNFTGGNVTLQIGGETAYEQDVFHNMTLIFPSSYYVGISEVRLENKELVNSGLYMINTYFFIESR